MLKGAAGPQHVSQPSPLPGWDTSAQRSWHCWGGLARHQGLAQAAWSCTPRSHAFVSLDLCLLKQQPTRNRLPDAVCTANALREDQHVPHTTSNVQFRRSCPFLQVACCNAREPQSERPLPLAAQYRKNLGETAAFFGSYDLLVSHRSQ